MGSLKKPLIIFVILPLIVAGGLYGIMYYKLQEFMEKTTAQLASFGSLKYGGLAPSFTGRLSVQNISFDIHNKDDVIHIESISYVPPNLMYLFEDNDAFNRGRLPASMRFEVLGLNMDLFGDITDDAEEMVKLLNANSKKVNPLCGGNLFQGPHEYRAMGYEDITIDSNIQYIYNKRERKASVTIEQTVRDAYSSYVKLNLTGFPSDRLSKIFSPEGLPRLTSVTIEYTDKSLNQRIVKNCAEKSNMPIDEYIEAEINQTPEYFAYAWYGIIPGPGIREAYRDFLRDPQIISLRFDIPEDVSTESLNLFQPEDIPGLLNLQLSVNSQPVEDLSFSYFDGKITSLQKKVAKDLAEKNAPEVKAKTKPRYKPAKYYRVAAKKLPVYIGKKVEITTNTGQKREGLLVRITGNTIHLERHLHGGIYDMTVSMSRVKTARVWLRKRK